MHRAIAKSCNTYFYSMGNRVGYDTISIMARRMGLGEKFDLPVVWLSYGTVRSEEHTSEIQALMPISYAVFCLKKQSRGTSVKRTCWHSMAQPTQSKKQQ